MRQTLWVDPSSSDPQPISLLNADDRLRTQLVYNEGLVRPSAIKVFDIEAEIIDDQTNILKKETSDWITTEFRVEDTRVDLEEGEFTSRVRIKFKDDDL